MILLTLTILLPLTLSIDDQEYNKYDGPSQINVMELDKDNFDQVILNSEEPWFVDFHAPWVSYYHQCDHCKQLRPIWAQLATQYVGKARFAKLAASLNRQFDERYNIKGYPTVVFIPGGNFVLLGPKYPNISKKHQGVRTKEFLQVWMDEMLLESKGFLLKQLTSPQDFQNYCVSLQKAVCILIILPNIMDSSADERNMHLQIARQVMNNYRDKPFSFMWTQDGDHPEFQQQFAIKTSYPFVFLINPNRKVHSRMTLSYTEQNFDKYLKGVLKRKGRYGSYDKEIPFRTVQAWDGQDSIKNQEL